MIDLLLPEKGNTSKLNNYVAKSNNIIMSFKTAFVMGGVKKSK